MHDFTPRLEQLERREVMDVRTWLPAPPPFLGESMATFSTPKFRVNAAGVIETHLPLYVSTNGGWVVTPHNAARYTLACYAAYRDGDDSMLAPMQANANWIVANTRTRTTDSGSTIWVLPYSFPISAFQIPAGFVSGLAAASEMCALYCASQALGSASMEAAAYNLSYVFDVTVAQGGVRVPMSTANRLNAWYEEYADPSRAGKTPLVLNGHLYACAWIYWYHRAGTFATSSVQRLRNLYDAGMTALAQQVALYDDQNVISVYDLMRRGHNPPYHHAHVALMAWHATVTGRGVFQSWSETWRYYDVPQS